MQQFIHFWVQDRTMDPEFDRDAHFRMLHPLPAASGNPSRRASAQTAQPLPRGDFNPVRNKSNESQQTFLVTLLPFQTSLV
eukprot:3298872-Amphidinium_carterae.2